MDINDCKLLSEAEDSYHIAFPSGKTFTLAKKGLNERAHSIIQKLKEGSSPVQTQKFADGGEVAAEDYMNAADAAENAPDSAMDPASSNLDMGSVAPTPDSVAAAAASPSPGSGGLLGFLAPSPDSVSDQFGTTDRTSALNPALTGEVGAKGDQKAPVASGVDPFQQKGGDTEALLTQQGKDIKSAMDTGKAAHKITSNAFSDYDKAMTGVKTDQQTMSDQAEKDAHLFNAVKDGKIDSNRLWNNMSGPSKVTAVIGTILGGFGSEPNATMAMLQRSIDRDVADQQADNSKNLNLYQMNRQHTQDLMQASKGTQNQLWTGVQAKLSQAQEMTQNASIKLNLQQLSDQIEQKKIGNRMMMGLMSGAGGALTPQKVLQSGIFQPGQESDKAGAELEKVQKFQTMKNMWNNSFNDLAHQVNAGKFSPSDRQSAIESIAGSIEHLTEGRLNRDQALAQAEAILPGASVNINPFSHEPLNPLGTETAGTVKLKRERGEQLLSSLTPQTPTLNTKGITAGMFPNIGGKATDQTETMNGQSYRKVDGGWQKVPNGN